MIDWEFYISLAILGVLLFAAFRTGKENPVSTGKLQQEFSAEHRRLAEDVHTTKNKLMALEGQMNNAATKADVETLRKEMKDSATSNEVKAISAQVNTVCAKVEGMEGAINRTDQGVKRLEHYFLKKGINEG